MPVPTQPIEPQQLAGLVIYSLMVFSVIALFVSEYLHNKEVDALTEKLNAANARLLKEKESEEGVVDGEEG